jgi:hypothetical protein
VRRFLVPLVICGLTICVAAAHWQRVGPFTYSPLNCRSPVPAFRRHNCRRQAIYCPVAVMGATAMRRRTDVEVRPILGN